MINNKIKSNLWIFRAKGQNS